MIVFILAPLLISLLYMGAWLSRWGQLLNLIPNSPAMVFNTALCLFLLCFNVLSFRSPRLRWFRQAWVAVFFLAALTGCQYIFSLQLGLDELFVPGYLHAFRSFPGRMSPISALCLSLLAVACGIRGNLARESSIWIWASALVFSFQVVILGFLSLLEHSFSLQQSLSWGSFAKISFASSLSFFSIGLALVGEIRSRLFTPERDPKIMRALLVAIVGLSLTMMSWQWANYEASVQIHQALRRELDHRYLQFYQAFQYRAEELQRASVPQTRQQAQAQNWVPPLESIKAVIRTTPRLQVIWQQNHFASTNDLESLELDVKSARDGFMFYPNLIYQRERYMAFLFQDRLWIFSPKLVINHFFPDDQFSYSLKLGSLVLATNTIGLIRALQDWQVHLPLRLWNDQLLFEVVPTKATLTRLESPKPQRFLITGLALTLIASFLAWALTRPRSRSWMSTHSI